MTFEEKNAKFPIAKKMDIIRKFTPKNPPTFEGTDDGSYYIIWGLYKRACQAIKSFVLLIDNRQYYDAFIIAGYMLETCAILSYINDNNDKLKRHENYDKYLARSVVGRLIANLELTEDLSSDNSWDAYEQMLKIFYPIGTTILKKGSNKKHEDIIDEIKFRTGKNEEKIRLLKKHYDPPRIDEYIKAFSDNLGNIDDGQFSFYYTKYCNYKHSNVLASDMLSDDFDENEVDWFLFLVLGMIMYLQKIQLPTTQNKS